MLTKEELADTTEREELKEDVTEECGKVSATEECHGGVRGKKCVYVPRCVWHRAALVAVTWPSRAAQYGTVEGIKIPLHERYVTVT